MGTFIRSTGISVDPSVVGSIAHAATAAKNCLAAAEINPEQVDLLINVGIYRDANMVEPSIAALVQKEVGINPDYVLYPSHKPALSFDLMNGACGMLSAVQVASSFLQTGKADHVLIVSSDSHPSTRAVPGFPYAALGAAMLLGRSSADRGFGPLRSRDGADGYVGAEGFLDIGTAMTDGRNAITFRSEPDYAERLLDLATTAAKDYAAEHGLELRNTLLVTSRPTPDFGTQLARRLSLHDDSAFCPIALDGDPHTSALTYAYHEAAARGAMSRYEHLLFVAAGAGLTTVCASYRN
jgi:3-oxoacyl-[acyl-carrier-protein] synthase-3